MPKRQELRNSHPRGKHNLITENLRGFEIKLKTKPGVFSKEGIDSGTKLLIDHMEISDGTLVCDLGCGTGVLGFVAAKLNPNGHVHLLDDHLRSVELAKMNAELNNLKNVEVFLSDLFSEVSGRSYHLILSNPPQHMGNEFLEEAANMCFKHLKPGGAAYWVVQKHVKPYVERLFKKVFSDYELLQGREHVVLKASII